MRRLLVGLMIVALVGTSAEAFRGRFGRGAHSQQSLPVTNPDPPPTSYIETLTMQTWATNGYCSGAHNVKTAIAASSDAVYIAYMDNTGGCGDGAHNIYVQKYSYTTGLVTTSSSLASVNPGCCDGHEAPSIFRNSSGFLYVFYGGVSCSAGVVDAPCYRKSTNADDITAWDAVQKVTGLNSGMSEPVGGFDSDGVLHIFGQAARNGTTINAFELAYARLLADGSTWQVTDLVKDNDSSTPPAQGSHGDPGCVPGAYVVGTTIYITWMRSDGGCSGTHRDVFLIKSTDGGDNWCAVDGTNCVARTTGVQATFDSGESLYDYPAAYRVYEGNDVYHMAVSALADGTPVVVFPTSTALRFRTWNGSAWTGSNIDTVSTQSQGASIVVTSADKILVHATNTANGSNGNFLEHVSTDGGSSFSSTTLRVDGSETRNMYPNARFFSSLGGKARVIVPWIQQLTSSATGLVVMDRPQ